MFLSCSIPWTIFSFQDLFKGNSHNFSFWRDNETTWIGSVLIYTHGNFLNYDFHSPNKSRFINFLLRLQITYNVLILTFLTPTNRSSKIIFNTGHYTQIALLRLCPQLELFVYSSSLSNLQKTLSGERVRSYQKNLRY